MTYEERDKTLCNNCEAKENCSYISRNLESKCSFKETTMYGWELGYKDAVDKAHVWLMENYDKYVRVIGSSIYFAYFELGRDLRKAMEDEL